MDCAGADTTSAEVYDELPASILAHGEEVLRTKSKQSLGMSCLLVGQPDVKFVTEINQTSSPNFNLLR